MSTSNLIRWAGLSAVAAGVLTIIAQILHPANEPAAVTTGSWAVSHFMILGSAIFGLLGITGLYARQVEKAGLLGLLGFLMLFVAEALITGFGVLEAFIMPVLAAQASQFIEAFFAFEGLGSLVGLLLAAVLLFGVGGLLFGIATLRVGILPRWAAIVFIIGTLLSVGAPALSDVAGKAAGVVLGLGLAWLGYALWSERRETTSEPAAAAMAS